MLQTIRDKLTGWVAGIIFAVIALAFMFWGIDPLSINANWAAKVNGEEVSAVQVRNAAQSQISQFEAMLQSEMPPQQKTRIRNSILSNYVNSTLLSQQVEKEGYRISDQVLQQNIRSLPFFHINGEFNAENYAASLTSRGMSVTGFESDQRGQLEVEQLQKGIADSAFVTPGEVRRFLELLREQREVAVVTVPVAQFEETVTPEEQEVVEYYESDPERFMTPETATVEYIEIVAADIAGQVVVAEEELTDFYEQIADRYRTDEQRRARHILIATSSERDNDAAAAIANEVVEKARAGEDFAALVTEYSDDGTTVAEGGDLGWSDRDSFAGPFADALFEMQTGEIAGPVQTRFGYHVILLDDTLPEGMASLDDVRAEVDAEYRQYQASELYYERGEALRAEAFEADSQLQGVAEKLGMELKVVESFTRAGGGLLGTDPSIISEVFSDEVLNDGRNSQLIDINDERAIVLRVAEYQAPEPRPLDEVRDQIVAFLITDKARDLAAEAGELIEDELLGGSDAQEVAAAQNASYTRPMTFARNSEDPRRQLVEAIFAEPRPAPGSPSVGSVMLGSGDYAVFSITSFTPGQAASLSIEEWNETEQQLADQIGNGEFSAYLAQLRNSAKISINERTFDDTPRGAPPIVP